MAKHAKKQTAQQWMQEKSDSVILDYDGWPDGLNCRELIDEDEFNDLPHLNFTVISVEGWRRQYPTEPLPTY